MNASERKYSRIQCGVFKKQTESPVRDNVFDYPGFFFLTAFTHKSEFGVSLGCTLQLHEMDQSLIPVKRKSYYVSLINGKYKLLDKI